MAVRQPIPTLEEVLALAVAVVVAAAVAVVVEMDEAVRMAVQPIVVPTQNTPANSSPEGGPRTAINWTSRGT